MMLCVHCGKAVRADVTSVAGAWPHSENPVPFLPGRLGTAALVYHRPALCVK